jgi:hypothetical protein
LQPQPTGGTDEERVAILVSGMHRSGTSALTRAISLLGAALPDHLIEGRVGDNEPGFWEGRAVVDLNQQILDAAGSWWAGWQRIDTDSLPERASVIERIRSVVREELAGAGDLLVIKDPRISRLLPLWTEALTQERYRTVHVVTVRPPQEVAASVGRRNGLGERASALSWLAHTLDAELFTQGQPRVFVSFTRLIDDWRREMTRVSDVLGVCWPRAYDDVAPEVDRFIDPGLRHRSITPLAAVEPVYAIVQRWCLGDERPEDRGELDRWRHQLAEVRSLSSPTALVSRRRQAAAAEKPGPGRRGLRNNRMWRRIEHEAFDLEAEYAWPAVERMHRATAE